MLNSKPVVALFAVGLVLIGFALGQYFGRPSEPAFPVVPPKPAPEAPVYQGPRPHAEFPARAPTAAPGREFAGGDLAKTLRELDLYTRAADLLTQLQTLGPEAVPEVKRLLADPSLDLGGIETDLLMRFWASHEPHAATVWAMHEAAPAYSPGATLVATEVWASRDPQAAANIVGLGSLNVNLASPVAEIGLIRGWYDSGQPGLEAYIQSLGVGFERQRALAVFARRAYLRNGPEALARWAEAISDDDPKFKLEAFRALAKVFADVNPSDAVAWCETHCDGPYGKSMRRVIATRWAHRDGEAAMNWLATAPEGSGRNQAVKGAYRGWAQHDREGVRSWVRAKGLDGVEPYLHPALENFALSIARKEPAEALEWAAVINEPKRRRNTMINIARQWRSRDEAAAEAWLAQSNLPEEFLERVRAPRTPDKRGSADRDAAAEPPEDGPESSPETP
jgi:hypothetical protein